MGGGIPLRPGADLFALWQTKYGRLASRLGSSSFDAARFDVTPMVQQTADRANAAGVPIHAIALPESGAASADSAARTGTDPEDAGRALRTLTASTGGRVSTDVQNPAAFLAGTGRDLAGSYSLGYTPSPGGPPGGPLGGKPGSHKIEVRVRGGQLAARYREERLDGEAAGKAKDPLLQRAIAALWGAGGTANPLRAELTVEEEAPEKDGRQRVTAIVSLPLATLTVQPQEHYHVAHLTLAVAARDGKGKISGVPHAEVPVEIPHDRLQAAPGESAGYRFTLHLAPGESVVAVAARDDSSGAESVVRAIYKGPGKGLTASPGDPAKPEASAVHPGTSVQVLPSAAAVESAALLMSGQEGGDLPLNALALYLPGEAGKSHVLLRMRMDGPALLAGQTGDALRIETDLYVLDPGGSIAASALETVGIDLAAERKAVEASGVDLLAGFDLKPGAYSLRLLARNAATGRLGVRTLPLTVPDPGALQALPLSAPPAADPRPTARLAGLGPLDPPPFASDAAASSPSQTAAAPAPVPETAEGRRLRSATRASYREILARLAAGRDAEALGALAALEDALLLPARRPASVEQVVDIEAGAARELVAASPESLVPLLRFHQRLYETAVARRRHPGSTVAQNVVAALLELVPGARERAGARLHRHLRDRAAAQRHLAAGRAGGPERAGGRSGKRDDPPGARRRRRQAEPPRRGREPAGGAPPRPSGEPGGAPAPGPGAGAPGPEGRGPGAAERGDPRGAQPGDDRLAPLPGLPGARPDAARGPGARTRGEDPARGAQKVAGGREADPAPHRLPRTDVRRRGVPRGDRRPQAGRGRWRRGAPSLQQSAPGAAGGGAGGARPRGGVPPARPRLGPGEDLDPGDKSSMKRLILFLMVSLAAAGAWAAQVRIVQPPPGQPLLGEVEVRVEVLPAGTPVERVEILLDGKLAGTAGRPPYHLLIDAGDDGREHRLDAVAYLADGSQARASLSTPRLQADAVVQVELQQLFLTVDHGGRALPDLTRDDFTVYDQGTPQPIATFGRGDVPFTAVLLVDSSASMAGPSLEKALDGARAFFSGLAPLDQAKLILFSDHVRLETPFTSVQPVLTLGLRGIAAEGGRRSTTPSTSASRGWRRGGDGRSPCCSRTGWTSRASSRSARRRPSRAAR